MGNGKPVAVIVQPEGLATILVGITLALCVITTIIVSLRVWFRYWLRRTRIEPNGWGWDDWLIGFGMLAFIAACCFTVVAAYYGLGMPDSKVNSAQRVVALQLVFFFQLSEAAFTILVKSSIAVFLIRLTTQKRYHYPLWFVIIATVAGCVVPGVVVITLCRPLAAQWDPSLGTCGDYGIITQLSYAVSVITVVTDWTCAIIPCILIRKLNIPPNHKLPLMATLSLGILASVASIGRMPYLKYYDATVDRLYGEANIVLWCIIEGALAFIAGSLPPLRKAPELLITKIKSQTSTQRSQSHVELEDRPRNPRPPQQDAECPYDNDSQHSLLPEIQKSSLKPQVSVVSQTDHSVESYNALGSCDRIK
ncbi:hypothetical protein F5B20DRAFT_524596 [Whalleya microplaca]|nr:hypothetical protein F5B20DRAFT_524596 [Whalleya microplaca]